MKRNPLVAQFEDSYLFRELKVRKDKFQSENPDVKLISLGVGDTSEPLSSHVVAKLQETCALMGTPEGYTGYGFEQGDLKLRELISKRFYQGKMDPDSIFISDGCKPDISRFQTLFGPNVKIALQNPLYPAYGDATRLHGVTNIQVMECSERTHYFVDVDELTDVDVIYICSPNNPTGAVATFEQLEKLIRKAKEIGAVIVFDAAYSEYIQDKSLPKSIFEVPGSEEVAIETSSFSKLAGFTGVRLGWTVVPEALKYEDGSSIRKDFERVYMTVFNGASNIIQQGGIAVLEDDGWAEAKKLVSYYLNNAKILHELMVEKGYRVVGGVNAPYLWVHMNGQDSWEVFERVLRDCHVIITPGAGFGEMGEGYIRFSSFGHLKDIIEARDRMKTCI
ncbi:MAG: LL-diaminopimelate aminotransferase [Chlamydiia bacterium]|nr:LL-diaminopimelate aminotransferase [Chlamydiia bacterium]MCH9615472.1 LL-diaminopimelate aminotransferase [Chlamydiia bacterium]MCH9629127.1 LL-diaminopimelate aminotransferase [Chlamydiia bacterium]